MCIACLVVDEFPWKRYVGCVMRTYEYRALCKSRFIPASVISSYFSCSVICNKCSRNFPLPGYATDVTKGMCRLVEIRASWRPTMSWWCTRFCCVLSCLIRAIAGGLLCRRTPYSQSLRPFGKVELIRKDTLDICGFVKWTYAYRALCKSCPVPASESLA